MYEERLSAADSKRYEMEDLIASLEEQLRAQSRPLSPSTLAKNAASAAEIDNEALRDQIQHLQRKISTLEDALEDARVLAEREELAVHDRIRRYREKEESLRKELQEGQDEAAKISQAEEGARHRVEEIEEALRENTVALENARAEIEGLRNEIAVSTVCLSLVHILNLQYRILRASKLVHQHHRSDWLMRLSARQVNAVAYKKRSRS